MKILQLCPLWFPVSKNAPGGIETFLAQLILALAEMRCETTIIAAGDSRTAAGLLPVVPQNIYEQMKVGTAREYIYYEQQQLQLTIKHAVDFDIVHSHIGPGAFVLSGMAELQTRVLHTIHSPVYEDLQWFVSQNHGIYFSTVSEFQARKLRQHGAKHCYTIPNGIDTAAFTFKPEDSESLLYIGRIEREKGPDTAVKVARSLGLPLILAGPIVQHDFFKLSVEPFLNGQIQYVGLVDHNKKNKLLGSAGCVLMPSRWAEPFGIVAIEAMACGTPVVALDNGALSEIVEPGLSGYLSKDETGLISLVSKALKLDRAAIRSRCTARFNIGNVAEKYLLLYKEIAAIP